MNNEKRFFIEIGSADMDTCIPLAENGWNGIIVEPINAYLKNLKRVDGVIYENLGISGDGSDYDITYIDMNYYTRKGFLPQHKSEPHVDIHAWVGDHQLPIDEKEHPIAATIWARGLGSMVSTKEIDNAVEQFPSLKDDIKTIKVETLTLNDLIKKHNVKRIDFMKIDVEGMEYDIISNYDWKIKPSFMKIEHQHMGDDYFRFLDILNSMGYKYWSESSDIYAIN